MKKSILYLCMNDGSDTRVAKEVESLSSEYNIHYYGFSQVIGFPFAQRFTSWFYVTGKTYKNILHLLNGIYGLIKILKHNRYDIVYIVDEQLYFLVGIFLQNNNVILDIFDSYFLKMNKPNDEYIWLKRLIYSLPQMIIVTDEDRKKLLPDFAQKKAFVLPNYPKCRSVPAKQTIPDRICIGYFGTLIGNRGTDFIAALLNDSRIYVEMAGWIKDPATQKLINHPRVNYAGILSQQKVNSIVAKKCDYLLMIYPNNNLNNYYASPNKLYDAIHTRTPVIINSDVRVSKFIGAKNIGILINLENDSQSSIIANLWSLKYSYSQSFTDEMLKEYSWDKYEKVYRFLVGRMA